MSQILVNTFQATVDQNLSKPNATRGLKEGILKYIDACGDQLLTSGPINRNIFNDKDKQLIYDYTGLSKETIAPVIKQNAVLKHEWGMINDPPFTITTILAIRFYAKKRNEEMVSALRSYLLLSLYPMMHAKYFKFGAVENVMDYTINNLSNKFKIKQLPTMLAVLFDTVEGSYRHHDKNIQRGSDKELKDFAMDIKTRVNSLLKNISKEYYKNHENKMYLNKQSDNFDPDDYRESDSNSFEVDRIATKVTLHLVTNGPNLNTVTQAAKLCKVSVNELRNYTNQLINGDSRDQIQEMNEAILFLYLFDEKNTARDVRNNMNFLVYCLEMYKKSNTSDPNIIKIKKILDEWLEDVGAYKKTQRVATLNDFRRSLFLFFVISIMNYA